MSNHFRTSTSDFDEDICLDEISKMKKTLTDAMYSHVCEHDISELDTEEAGEIIDMIKDLAAAERYCAQACYYHTVTEAMQDGSQYRMGYTPDEDDGYFYDENGQLMHDLVYRPKQDSRFDRMMKGIRVEEDFDPHYGKSFNEFRKAKKHYTETRSGVDRDAMHDRGEEHVMESISTIKEIWSASDADLKKRMKESLTKLVAEMA